MASGRQTRLLLVAGIVLAGGFSIYLHFELSERKEAAEQAARNDPAARTQRAILEADRAMLNGKLKAARNALEEALEAIQDAIAIKGEDRRLLRSRLVVTRRLGHVSEKLGEFSTARGHFKVAVSEARELFSQNSTDSRSRSDRLSTVREYADLSVVPRPEAATITAEAAQAVAAASGTVVPSYQVSVQIGETWLTAAQAAAETKDMKALQYARRGLETALASQSRASEPATGLSHAYGIAAKAVGLAEELRAEDLAMEFEMTAVKLLESRRALASNDAAVGQALGARYGRLADHAARRGDEDEALTLHRKAIDTLTAIFEQQPDDQQARLSLVRGLNLMAAYHAHTRDNKKALSLYGRAAELAVGLGTTSRRTQLITLGNHAQLLGRLNRIRKARRVAKKALGLAAELSEVPKADRRSLVDLVSAELRYARLLRSAPQARLSEALKLARSARDRLDAMPGPSSSRKKSLLKGVNALLAELR